MSSIVRYWQFNRLNLQGKVTIEERTEAKRFIQERYPEITRQASFSDAVIQRDLFALFCQNQTIAEICLRCFISRQIREICRMLEFQFGNQHHFTRYDLFPLLLDDLLNDSKSPKSKEYIPMATKILQTFDPQKASLSTWTTRLVRSEPTLTQFLLEHGVYLISDWAILNDTTPKQLQRIFREFHHLDETIILQACHLLIAYHEIYRRERLAARQTGKMGKCPVPSSAQLEQIAHLAKLELTSEETLAHLQDLAAKLREYRIFVRGGHLKQDSLDNETIQFKIEQQQVIQGQNEAEEEEQNKFLGCYRQQFLTCLEKAIATVVTQWLNQQKDSKKEQFISALKLFHCQGYSMSEIASLIGLKAQYQVTRLMKLKNFRSDIRQQLLQSLRSSVLEMASCYTSPEQLLQQERQIESALEEQVTKVIEQAETEASMAKNQPLKSLLAQYLCHYLHQQEK